MDGVGLFVGHHNFNAPLPLYFLQVIGKLIKTENLIALRHSARLEIGAAAIMPQGVC